MEDIGRRIDFHAHSLLSDGLLLPSEVVRRAQDLGYQALAITDHVDASNIDSVIPKLVRVSKELDAYRVSTRMLPGVEVTHVPPKSIDSLARQCKELGARVVVVHGETLVEPVIQGTNSAAVQSKYVDVLAHPGLITLNDAKIARKNNVFLEVTSRKGHSLTNGHVVRVAQAANAKLVINSDTHAPEDFINQEEAFRVGLGAGLSKKQAIAALVANARALLHRAQE